MLKDSWDIVSWNVNSLRARLPRVLAWLEAERPHILCLQETKCPDVRFPRAAFQALGYHASFRGQENGLNGVAILSRTPQEEVLDVLAGREDDDQRRFLSARIGGVRVLNVYVPNGQSLTSEAFFYKLDWLSRLQGHLVAEHHPKDPLVLLGDFNIAPDDRDVWAPEAMQGALHCSQHERRALGYLHEWGLQDALRCLRSERGLYTWFDYREAGKDFDPQRGLRIDLVYLTEVLSERLQSVDVDLKERAGERPSDHAPLRASFRGAPLP